MNDLPATYSYGELNTVYLVDSEALSKSRNDSGNVLLDIEIMMQQVHVDTPWTVVILSVGVGGIKEMVNVTSRRCVAPC